VFQAPVAVFLRLPFDALATLVRSGWFDALSTINGEQALRPYEGAGHVEP